MDSELYDYSPITERDPVSWPGGARIAFYAGLNVEHFLPGQPSTSFYEGTAALVR
jgi:allantoinase